MDWEMKQYTKRKPLKFNLLVHSSTKISASNITRYMVCSNNNNYYYYDNIMQTCFPMC